MVKEIKNILIIGRTNSGKSALANVLINRNGNFEEVFEENPYSVNKVKRIKAEETEVDGIRYQIVDIGDNNSLKEKMLLIGREINLAKEGINQIFFTSRDGFAEQNTEEFKLLKTVFGDDIVKYITIVRTHFPSSEYFNLSTSGKVIYVDNLPINIKGSSKEVQIKLNKEKREESRNKLFEHLEKNCRGNYKLVQGSADVNKEVKNILIVGRIGGGKLALADVLFNSFEEGAEFQKVFKESEYSIGCAKDFQEKEFEWKGINYCLIDTPRFNNAQLSERWVLDKVEEKINSLESISQIFLIVKSRNFIKEEKDFLKLLETIAGSKDTKRITIMRIDFPNFKNEGECKKDSNFLISSCEAIHIDNPSLVDYSIDDIDKETRELSRKKLLDYLHANCLENYKLGISSGGHVEEILLIGRVSSGKSALANVISGTSKFEESEYSASKTKGIQVDKFELKGINYCVIDIPGIDSSFSTKEEVPKKIKREVEEVIGSEKEISQIFFVSSSKFTEEDAKSFEVLKNFFGSNKCSIVRTRFPSFEDDNSCVEDKKQISNLVKDISYNRIIHVDNPPLGGLLKHLKEFCLENNKMAQTDLVDENLKKQREEIEKLKEQIKQREQQTLYQIIIDKLRHRH